MIRTLDFGHYSIILVAEEFTKLRQEIFELISAQTKAKILVVPTKDNGEPDMTAFILKTIRQYYKLSRRALAKKLALANSHIRKLESGQQSEGTEYLELRRQYAFLLNLESDTYFDPCTRIEAKS